MHRPPLDPSNQSTTQTRHEADPGLIVIERRRWPTLGAAELWSYRELLYFLVWRDIQVRYKQTLLGIVWAVLQPLASMAIFSLLFARLAGFSAPGVPYPLYAYCGFLLWTFFANAISGASNSLVGSSQLLTKVYFPRLLIPAGAVMGAAFDLLLGAGPLVGLLAWYRVVPTWRWLWAPVPITGLLLLAVGVGTLLAAANVKFRDVRHAVPFVVQLWMFATPTFYLPSVLPPRWRWLATANPVTGWIDWFRGALLGLPIDGWEVASSALGTMALLVIGLATFRYMERSFADLV